MSAPWSHVLEQRMRLVEQVTPVRYLPALSAQAGRDIFVKQDDLTSGLYGGTKVRKLEFILHAARQASAGCLVTLGSWGSHHVAASTLHARAFGWPVHAVVAPQPASVYLERNVRLNLATGAVLHPVGSDWAVPLGVWRLMRQLRREGARPYHVSLGGSSACGTLGTVRAALELTEQVARGEAPARGPVVVALGSGSTVAGLALGMVLAGAPRTVHAVRVASRLVVHRAVMRRLLTDAAALLVPPRLRAPLVRAADRLIAIDHMAIGRGYGWATPAGEAAMAACRTDGLVLEPVYTAKAMAALLNGMRGDEPALYWHTLADAPSLPLDAVRLPSWFRAPG